MKKRDKFKSVLSPEVFVSKLMGNRLLFGFCFCSSMLVTGAVADHPTAAFGTNGAGGPIVTISADTLPEGKFAVGIQNELINNDAFSTEQLEAYARDGLEGVHSVNDISSSSLAIAYGVSENFTLSARLPYISRTSIRESEIEDGEPEAHLHGNSSGFGDILILGQYRVYNELSTKVSLNVGLKIPTGESDVLDNDGNAFEAEFQPSSGSSDGLFGVAVSKNIGKFGLFSNVLYTKTTEGVQNTRIGDVLNYNFATTYRIVGSECNCKHTDSSALGWDMVLELNGEARSKNEIAGAAELNSGGNLVYFSPGLKVSSGNVGGFVSFGIPVAENQNGIQADIDQRIIAGLSMVF